MLKYDYFSVMQTLADKSSDAVGYACTRRVGNAQRIPVLRAECHKLLCDLERALFSEFLPPLDRASIAAYAHALCDVTDNALLYAGAAPIQYAKISQKDFDSACLSLCEILCETTAVLDKIKKSSEIPRLEEFREKKALAIEKIFTGASSIQSSRTPHIFIAREELLASISYAFDSLVEIILKNI